MGEARHTLKKYYIKDGMKERADSKEKNAFLDHLMTEGTILRSEGKRV